MFSIYGRNLGPAESCVRDAGPFRPEGPNSPEELEQVEKVLPSQLCGVQVLLDEEPVPLIYVHEKQINFVVPGSRPFGNRVMLRVIRTLVSSVPVSLKFGPDQMSLYPDQPTYSGMPVWIHLYNIAEGRQPVELPFGLSFMGLHAQCPHIEVKYDGVLLPERQIKSPPRQMSYSGPPCPSPPVPDRQSLAGRIPLHLRYCMDLPGIYLVRYVPGPDFFHQQPTTAETDWTPVDLKPARPEQRRKWLLAQAQAAPTSREDLLYDFLPSIFGYGDSEALNLALKYLYFADSSVSSATAGYLRDYYTASQLIPILQREEQQRGKNRTVDRLLDTIGANHVGR